MGVSIYRYIAIDDNPSKISSKIFRFRQLGSPLSLRERQRRIQKRWRRSVWKNEGMYVIPKGERAAALLLAGDTGEAQLTRPLTNS